MEQVRTSERRSGRDRRTHGASSYSGTERRSLMYRRGLDLVACIYCKKVCDAYGNWSQTASVTENITEYRAGICPECSSTRFPQFYTNTLA